MADGRSKQGVPGRDEAAPGPTPQNSAEAKRLQARRRFLLGGAAALPVILHVTATGAQVDPPPPVDPIGSFSFCLSLTGQIPTVNFDQSTTAFICPK
ncbi:MAG: hypothetical protein V3T55_00300 [Anaerolineales bacterium]